MSWSLGPSCKGKLSAPEIQLSPENPLHVDTPNCNLSPASLGGTLRGQVACGQDPSTRTRGMEQKRGWAWLTTPSRDSVQPTPFHVAFLFWEKS